MMFEECAVRDVVLIWWYLLVR